MLYPCQLLSDLFNVGSLSVSPQSLNCLVRLLFGLLIWLLGHPNERTGRHESTSEADRAASQYGYRPFPFSSALAQHPIRLIGF
jgi:hypothetical protein